MKRFALTSCVAFLAPSFLTACSNSTPKGAEDSGPTTSPAGPPLPYGLGFIPDTVNTGPEGQGSAFATSGVGFAGSQIDGLSGPSTLPTSADLTQWNPPVGNQGILGSCCSWSYGYSLPGWWANKYSLARPQFSPMYVYSQWAASSTAACSDPQECGAAPESLDSTVVQPSGVDAIVDYDPFMPPTFNASQATMPNFGADCSSNDYSDLPTTEAKGFAKTYGMSNFSYRLVAQSDAGSIWACPGFPGTSTWVQQQIANGVPLMVGVPIWPEFDGYTSGGPAVTPPSAAEVALEAAVEAGTSDAGAPLRGGHEIFCDKYDANGLWCQNQWGADQGTAGFWQLSWAFVDQCMVEEATAVLTFVPTPPIPVIASPTADGGMDGGLDCSDLEVDVNVLLGPVNVNTVTLYANGTQIDQQQGADGEIVDGGGSFDGGPDAGVVGDGGDGWADDFVFEITLDGGTGDGGVELKVVAVDDAGLTGTAIVNITCASTSVPDAGDAGSSCSSTGAECTGNGSCCSGSATCMSDGVNSTCCFPAGTAPDNGDSTDCCNGNGLDSNGKCL